MSMVLIPAFAAIIGPMVDPQRLSFLTINSYKGTPALTPSVFRMAIPTESVIYLWFALILITMPSCIIGRC